MDEMIPEDAGSAVLGMITSWEIKTNDKQIITNLCTAFEFGMMAAIVVPEYVQLLIHKLGPPTDEERQLMEEWAREFPLNNND